MRDKKLLLAVSTFSLILTITAIPSEAQTIPPPPEGSSIISVDPWEITTTASPAGQKGTARKSSSEAPMPETQLAAVCKKLIRVETDFSQMEDSELDKVEAEMEECIPVLRGDFRKLAISHLKMAVFLMGWTHGSAAASKRDEDRMVETSRSGEAEKKSVIHDYDKLVDRYNALGRDYNGLVDQYNALVRSNNTLVDSVRRILASSPTHASSLPLFVPPPPPAPATHLNCTAVALPGNMATINCW